MERFLLLRDNKQTGPYSAADLKQMGLKSYDLIWVDGKSAAWRYPGEIDALKSFAPPVKEQPYDRFFKKEPDDKPRFPPKEEIKPMEKEAKTFEKGPDSIDKISAKHIFVSIPNNKKSQPQPKNEVLKSEPQLKNNSPEPFLHRDHAGYLPAMNPVERFPDRSSRNFEEERFPVNNLSHHSQPSSEFVARTDEKPPSLNTKRKKGFNPVYLMAAALFLFALISVFLYRNYKEQNKQLNRLNQIVLNMQQDEGIKTTTPVYNAVAPVLHPNTLATDSLDAPDLNMIPVERSPEQKVTVKKPVIKKAVTVPDTAIKELETDESAEIKPAPVLTSNREGRTAKRRGAFDQLKITTNDFKVGFLGGISGLKVTLSNNGEAAMEKVDVSVEYLSKENKVVKTQVLTFKNIAPGAALTQDVPRVARGISVRCKVGDAQTAESVASNQEPSGKTP